MSAVRKHVRLFNPHLLLRKALLQPESVTIQGDADYKGAAHAVVELADAFQPVRLFIDKESGAVAKVETVEDDPLLGDNTNKHHHVDHSGGLRTYVAEGATVVTAQPNETYFKQVFAAPHKARPDALEQKPTTAKIQTVGATPYDISEGTRRVRVMPLATTHADGMLMVYVEDVQLLLVADICSPGFFPANMPIHGPFAAGAKEPYMALSTSGLTIQNIAGVHGVGTATFATLRTQAGF